MLSSFDIAEKFESTEKRIQRAIDTLYDKMINDQGWVSETMQYELAEKLHYERNLPELLKDECELGRVLAKKVKDHLMAYAEENYAEML